MTHTATDIDLSIVSTMRMERLECDDFIARSIVDILVPSSSSNVSQRGRHMRGRISAADPGECHIRIGNCTKALGCRFGYCRFSFISYLVDNDHIQQRPDRASKTNSPVWASSYKGFSLWGVRAPSTREIFVKVFHLVLPYHFGTISLLDSMRHQASGRHCWPVQLLAASVSA